MATANDPLVMQLIRFEFRHIYAIDQIAQTFSARVLAIFVIPSQVVMARGEELCTGLKDEDKPRFRSARWYASMLRFNNMQDGGGSNLPSTNVVEAKDGSLEITLVAEGTFHDAFQLQRFPVDVQDLIVHVTCLCANEKSVPVRLEIPQNQRQYKARVDMENFTLSNVWRLENAVMVSDKSILAKELGLSYPGIKFQTHVHRRAGYYYINVCAPLACLVLLALCQFAIAPEDVADRLSVSLTLLLTAIAFKTATASLVPPIAYLTILDFYELYMILIMVLSVVAAPVASLEGWQGIDHLAVIVLVSLWALAHLWFFLRLFCIKQTSNASRWAREREKVHDGQFLAHSLLRGQHPSAVRRVTMEPAGP